jgi:hypothetical protein
MQMFLNLFRGILEGNAKMMIEVKVRVSAKILGR